MEQLVQMLLEVTTLWGVGARQQESLFELAANGRCFLVDLHLVPTLLQKVCTIVVTTVGITERDVFQVVIWFGERIAYLVGVYGMLAGNHIYQHTLTAAVTAHNSHVLALVEVEVYRLGQTPFWLTCGCIL